MNFLMTSLRDTLRWIICSFLLILILWGFASAAFARDMQGRLGLGFNRQWANFEYANRVPAVSIKYGLTRDIAFEGVAGVSTASPTNSVAGIKLFKNLFFEQNLNFYFMLGGGLLRANNVSGAEFMAGFGAEFFIPGIESLGFSVETGGTLDNLSGSFALKTLGVSFLDAGIHFYF